MRQPDRAMRQPMGVAPRVEAADRNLPGAGRPESLRGFVLVDEGTSATLATVMVQALMAKVKGCLKGPPPSFAIAKRPTW